MGEDITQAHAKWPQISEEKWNKSEMNDRKILIDW
jgi:hypothetical protein